LHSLNNIRDLESIIAINTQDLEIYPLIAIVRMTSFRRPSILDNDILQGPDRKNATVRRIADHKILVENSHNLLYDKMYKLLTYI
jgi:hypothetical protein